MKKPFLGQFYSYTFTPGFLKNAVNRDGVLKVADHADT